MGKKCKTLLLITSSGGEGHIQAAKARAAQARTDNPGLKIIQKDILIDWVGKWCGKLLIHIWNLSQKKGRIKLLNFFAKHVALADALFWPRIFSKALITVIREDIDHIIDTQPIGTLATVKALKIVQYLTGKTVIIEKVLTELPTEQVLHFFKPIKGLNRSDRAFLKLVSHKPLLRFDETPNAFWMKHCGLRESDIRYDSFPLRAAFASRRDQLKAPTEQIKVRIQVSSYAETELIVDTIGLGTLHKQVELESITVTIQPHDKVVTMILGSHPTEEATIQYVKHFIDLSRKAGDRGYCYLLFVFCHYDASRCSSLLHRVHRVAQAAKNYPKHLNIVPMCFQEDRVIATLYSRSDATITRSGGLTSMELMSVARGKIWIHSEAKVLCERGKSHYGMPVWEWGNARYLQEKKGAQLITPDTFFNTCASFFMLESAS